MNSSTGTILAAATIFLLVGCRGKDSAKSNIGTTGDDQIELAVIEGDVAKVQTLLEQGFPVSGTSSHVNAPAFWAISENKPEILKVLIRHGLDVNYDWGIDGGNLLTNATQFGHIEVVRVLLENGASPERDSKNGRTPLYAAIIYDRQDIKALLLEHEAELNSWDKDALLQLGISDISEEAEQDGTEQPATRSQSKSEGSDKPQPEAEGRSR